ncbi:TonB-dependent receptor [Alteromonas sp. 5E99-2]|uniref:TonB-dependent receptor n=1 Tax=Alteromonas sp. 5E99-2 TaxID=2817683 RepID=UPI001A97DAA8|nr:TonB-dependent receptor [Alteromonas sp. 5E99-2]MBO1254420.1 TonB-dependent receptor [Alteromonas sp. 5E99-2]
MNKLNKITALMMLPLLSSSALAASVSGVIKDTAGQPIEGAVVSVLGSSAKSTTDEKGRYSFDQVSDGHVHLHIYSPSYVHGDREIENASGAITADFALTPSSIENIVITANALHNSVLDSVMPVSVLAGEALRDSQAPTLGETLKSLPGINSSYFGPVSARPIIRGNDGPRVKITQNSLDVSDASVVGVDHNVGTDASTATQIEVLRGPATLQYGSGAIGGVINVVDNRILSQLPTGLEGQAELRHETASDEKFAKVDLNTSVGQWAFHLDAFDRQTNDIEIPGFAEREPDEGEEPGTLENSSIDNQSVTLGLSYVGEKGYLGFSVQQLDNLYGIPGGHGHEEEEDEHDEDEHDEDEHEGEEEETVTLDVDNTRYQIAGELLSPFKGVNSIKLAAGYTDYEHVELEGDEIGTLFANETTELRLTAANESIAGWHGVFGFHYAGVEFEALGEEAFTPPSETDMLALFVVQQKRFDNLIVELGARVETNDLSADPFDVEIANQATDVTTVLFDDLDFTSLSLSAGYNWQYTDGYSFAVNIARSERAPTQQELYSAGEHVSTRTFDLGLFYSVNEEGGIIFSDAGIEEEVSTNIDVSLRKFSGDWGFTISAFYNQIDDYIYQVDTGFALEGGELPLLNFRQEDADLYGFEAEVHYQVNKVWDVSAFSDFIRAEVDSGDLPRIPPLRIGGEVAFDYNGWKGDLGVTWYDDQDQVADFETETDGYTLLELGVNYTLATEQIDWVFFARGTNLTDEEARVHSSFLVDDAPLPGRSFTLGVRAHF